MQVLILAMRRIATDSMHQYRLRIFAENVQIFKYIYFFFSFTIIEHFAVRYLCKQK